MRAIIWFLVCLLIILHHDFWFWTDRQVLLGMPIGLTYHVFLSMLASVVWGIACFTIWPAELDDTATDANGGDK